MSAWHEHHLNRTWNVHKSPMLQSSWNPRITKPKFLSPHSKPWKGQNSLLSIASWAYGKQGMNNNEKKTEDISCRKRHWHQAFGSYKKKKGNRKLKECLSGFLLLKIKKENKPKKKKKRSRIAREAHWKDRDEWGVGKAPKRNKVSTAASREIFMFFYLGITLILKEQLVEDEETTLVWTRVEQLCGFFGQPRYCGGRSRLLHT